MIPSPHTRLRALLTAALAAGLLTACGADKSADNNALAIDIDRATSCSLDGMLLADYPGPKAQIHYEGGAEPDFFCDTVELFSIYLKPEQARRVTAIYVQDMGKADWQSPIGHWIDARTATYVHGSRRTGSMGPTIASFASAEDARKFAATEGGKVLRFDEITADMVVLDGGAAHDKRM